MLDDFVPLSFTEDCSLVIKAWKHTKCSNNSVVIDVY